MAARARHSSAHCNHSQEADSDKFLGLAQFFLLIQLRATTQGMESTSHIRVSIPISINLIQIILHRGAQGLVSSGILDAIKLTNNINHHMDSH